MKERAWAEINLDALVENIRNIRKITSPGAKVMGVVKSDAYGHGAIEVSKAILENGADYLAVATVEEGVELREAGIEAPILILGATADSQAEEIIQHDIMPSVFSVEYGRALSNMAKKLGKEANIYIKLDTGMSRIGFVADRSETVDEIAEIASMPNIMIQGIFSHFSTADEADDSYTKRQFEKFMGVCGALESIGVKIPIKSIANSASIMMYPEYHLDMVRAGIVLYGSYPSKEVDFSRLPLRKVMSLKARISRVERPGKGAGVSYGNEYITDENTIIATVPIGYADGYTRLYKNKAKMIVRGETVPVIGRICMDQCMIDVTNVHNIKAGDEVIIFGDGVITADDLADWIGTISYEVYCNTARRIPRIYVKDNKVVKVLNYLRREAK